MEYEIYLTVDTTGDHADLQVLLENNGCHDQFGNRQSPESVEYFTSFELAFAGGGREAITEFTQNHRVPAAVVGKAGREELTAYVRWGWQNHSLKHLHFAILAVDLMGRSLPAENGSLPMGNAPVSCFPPPFGRSGSSHSVGSGTPALLAGLPLPNRQSGLRPLPE